MPAEQSGRPCPPPEHLTASRKAIVLCILPPPSTVCPPLSLEAARGAVYCTYRAAPHPTAPHRTARMRGDHGDGEDVDAATSWQRLGLPCNHGMQAWPAGLRQSWIHRVSRPCAWTCLCLVPRWTDGSHWPRCALPQIVCDSRLRVRGTGSERVGEAGEVRYWAPAAVIYGLSSRVVGKG